LPAGKAETTEEFLMAFSTGGGGGLSSDINVTPMIDILLVLLIIFMAITPVSPKGLEALVPQPPKNNQPQKENDTAIVVSILHGNGAQPSYKINETDVQKSDLAGRLQTIFSTRATKVMFIKADKELDFAPVANAIDIAKGAGVDHVGLITPKIAAGQ
jgi:biopolymer transport protein ExbD